jgi:hypothetical protein
MLVLCVGAAVAQEAASEAKSDACQPLEDADLPSMLQNMGYEPEKLSEGVWRVVIEQDGWTFYIRMWLSTDNRQKLWMTTGFGDIKDWDGVPAEVLKKLMISNDAIGPAHFYIAKSGEVWRLNMGKALDNRGISPAVLRRELDKFLSTIKTTADLWDQSTWTQAAAATPVASAPAVQPTAPVSAATPADATGPDSAATPAVETGPGSAATPSAEAEPTSTPAP